MANLNLSEFTEKLFVADADHTFIWDSAASISKRVSRNSWLNSGTLTSDAPVTISQTWNQIGTAFTAFKVNAVSTASASGSLLLDLQMGTASKFNVNKNGFINVAYSADRVFRTFSGANGFNLLAGPFIGNNLVIERGDAAPMAAFNSTGFTCISELRFAISVGNFNVDTILLRDGAPNTLALRNGTAAQTFRVYNTYTDASNYERGLIGWVGGIFEIGSQAAGTGATRHTRISSVNTIAFATSGIERWRFSSAGNLIADADNTYDIGASGANRPRNLYVGSNIYASGNVGIGTTAPGAKLDIVTSAAYDGLKVTNSHTTSGAIVSFVNNVGSNGVFGCYSSGTADGLANNAACGAKNSLVLIADGEVFSGGTNSIQLRTGGYGTAQERMRISAAGNVGIGTTSPTSKLHVAGSSSPSITVDNTLATGASQLLFKNTVVTGDTDGIFLNGSTQTGFGGAGSLNIKATTGPIAFHTASVTNAFSIAQSGAATFSQAATFGNDINGQRDVYCASNRYFRIGSSMGISSSASGVLTFAALNPPDSIARLTFGGIDATFPALKRSGTSASFDVVLANDSGFTSIQDLYRRFGAGSPNGVVTAPVGAVYHCTDGGAGTSFYVKESGTGNTGWVGK